MTWDRVERFEGGPLDSHLWIPEYLPHWTTPDRSAARYAITDDGLELRIDHDQRIWRTEDGEFRVSNVQTGDFSGPLGSTVGQHRVGRDLVVRTPRSTQNLWTPRAGAVEVLASASADPTCMLGIWLVGHEESGPADSGEICIAEVFGSTVSAASSTVRTGIKAHHDRRLETDVVDVALPMDATQPHTYGCEWDHTGVRITVDGVWIYRTAQALTYPVQLMLDLFEFPAGWRGEDDFPKTATIHEVRLRADG